MAEKEKMVIDWKNVAQLAVILFIITAVAALLLGLTNYVTAPTILEQNVQANTEARQKVLPEAEKFEVVESIGDIAAEADPENAAIVMEAYAGYKGQTLVGYTVKTAPSGYGGAVEVLTGISADGKISGITILSQSETPGLGAKSTDPAFQEQFKDKDAGEEVTVVKGSAPTGNAIQAITGATITSKAVSLGVNTSDNIFNALIKKGAK